MSVLSLSNKTIYLAFYMLAEIVYSLQNTSNAGHGDYAFDNLQTGNN